MKAMIPQQILATKKEGQEKKRTDKSKKIKSWLEAGDTWNLGIFTLSRRIVKLSREHESSQQNLISFSNPN